MQQILRNSPDGLAKALKVIMPTGIIRWADLDDISAYPQSFQIVQSRTGVAKRALYVEHREAAIASHIGAHNKGNAFRQQLPSGHVWALTGVQV